LSSARLEAAGLIGGGAQITALFDPVADQRELVRLFRCTVVSSLCYHGEITSLHRVVCSSARDSLAGEFRPNSGPPVAGGFFSQ
jgi:hypothetical protein